MAPPKFDQPATYRITVASHLGRDWNDYLHGMAIDNREAVDGKVAVLTGHLVDQGALLGVLNTLYDRHVAVLTVECLSGDCEHLASV